MNGHGTEKSSSRGLFLTFRPLTVLSLLLLFCPPLSASSADDALDQLMERASVLRSEWREPSLRDAISIYLEVARQAERAAQPAQAGQATQNIGDIYFILSEYREALDQYQRARLLWKSAGQQAATVRVENLIGYVHVYSGNSEKGLNAALRALSYYRRTHTQDLRPQAEAENCAGEASASLGRLRQAIGHFERALDRWTNANDKTGQALAILNMAYAYHDLGDIQKSQEFFAESISLYQGEGDKRGEARSLTGLGSIHSLLGEKQAALDKHVKSMEILRAIGDHAGEAVARNSIGGAYEELNNLPTALDNYNQALVFYRQQGNLEFESVTRYYIGRTYKKLGERQLALQFCEEAVAQSKLASQPRVTAYALTLISALQSQAGEEAKALAQLRQAVHLYRAIGDRRGEANALNETGHINRAAGKHSKALAEYKGALALYRAAGDRSHEANTLYYMAVAEMTLNELDAALAHVKESNEAIESLRAQIISPDLRASYYASVHKHAELYIDLLMRLSQLRGRKDAEANAFEVSEHSRSRALLETLGEAAAQIRQGVNPVLLEQERSLQQKLNAKAFYRMRLLANKSEPGELETVARDIRELTTSYRELQTQIKQQSPRYANLVQPQPLKLQQIQAELTDDTLLLQYSLGGERSYLWAVTKDAVTSYKLPARDVITDQVKSVCALIVARQTIDDSDLAAYNDQVAIADLRYWKEAAPLSKMLLGPVATLLDGKTILIVGDDALQYLAFEALPAPDDNGDGAQGPVPLIVNHEFVKLPSASILATIRQSRRAESDPNRLIAILADPVFSASDPRLTNVRSAQPSMLSAEEDKIADLRNKETLARLSGTRNEAETIMSLVPAGTGMMAMGFDANRDVAMNGELGLYKIVHLATHGIVDRDNPEMSGIMFSLFSREGTSKEGFVQLHDIYNLNLSGTQLVVLSACETGLGKDVRGEGLVGLSRGFIYAGSSSVIASLWKVQDNATSQLMTQFYKGVFDEGLTPSAALRKAKTYMWRQPRYREPFYWAAFALQGEYREKIALPPKSEGQSSSVLLAIGVSVAAAILLILYTVRKRSNILTQRRKDG